MTDLIFETYARSLLNDATVSSWSAEEFAAYKQVGILTVTSSFWNLLFPLQKKPELISLAVGENLLVLPATWHKTIRVEIASTGQPLKPIPDSELPDYYSADAGEPAGYTFQEGKLRILPDSTAVLTNYLRHWYLPQVTTLAELPEVLHPLIAVETVIAGRTKDENVAPHLSNLRDRFEWVARKDLVMYQTQAPLSIPDEFEKD